MSLCHWMRSFMRHVKCLPLDYRSGHNLNFPENSTLKAGWYTECVEHAKLRQPAIAAGSTTGRQVTDLHQCTICGTVVCCECIAEPIKGFCKGCALPRVLDDPKPREKFWNFPKEQQWEDQQSNQCQNCWAPTRSKTMIECGQRARNCAGCKEEICSSSLFGCWSPDNLRAPQGLSFMASFCNGCVDTQGGTSLANALRSSDNYNSPIDMVFQEDAKERRVFGQGSQMEYQDLWIDGENGCVAARCDAGKGTSIKDLPLKRLMEIVGMGEIDWTEKWTDVNGLSQ